MHPAWYAEGLRFDCTSCGRCCTGSLGYVWVDEPEIRGLAASLGMEVDLFGSRFLRRVGLRYALLESPVSGDCVFLDGTACEVYAARPRQCRSYPFWDHNLRSEEAWSAAAKDCEGIRPDARLVSADEIAALRRG
jgi:Fe-S-cluster containining protein